ncbi:Spy/CpxP family protein refolding chaperone [Thioalkalivibrio sp. HK1]|uniref:Spy/CpxP family protein refolding chaperone n=1 Tax=Thioalkalivibrio sp. HK1 TaxID=1469245 RepID=UPI0004B7FFDF|nr:periplasmic heavy metal sensor [Thioalkalivibrio sp. HK1]
MQSIPNENSAKSERPPSLLQAAAIAFARKIEIAARFAVLIALSVSMASLSAIPAAAASTKTVENIEDAVIDPMSPDPAHFFAASNFLIETHGGYDDAEGKKGQSDRFTKRTKRTVRKMLRRIDASPEQKERIDAIVDRSLDDIHSLRSEFQKSRRAFLALLAQESPDGADLDEVRSEMLHLDNEINARILGAVIEISEVLTPDQRRMVISKFSGKRGFFGRLMRWHDKWHDRHHDGDDDHDHDRDHDRDDRY